MQTELEDTKYTLDIINNQLGISCTDSDIRDIYRIGKDSGEKTRPTLIEFVNYKLKKDIQLNSRKLKGTRILIGNDYTPEDYEQHKLLRRHLKVARQNNLEATIKNKVLIVNGAVFTYEDLKEGVDICERAIAEEGSESKEHLAKETVTTKEKPADTSRKTDQLSFLKNLEYSSKNKKQNIYFENPVKRSNRFKNK